MPTLSRMLAQLGAFVRLGRLGEATTTTHMRGLVREHEELADVIAGGLSKVEGVHSTTTHIAFRSYSSRDEATAFSFGLD